MIQTIIYRKGWRGALWYSNELNADNDLGADYAPKIIFIPGKKGIKVIRV
jgi:hypothetical protein